MGQRKKIKLSVELNDRLNYALQQNGVKLIKSIILQNTTDTELRDLCIKISTDTGLTEPFEQRIDSLQPQRTMRLKGLQVLINGEFLAALTERLTCALHIGIWQEEKLLAQENREIICLAYDEWSGYGCDPDMVAAFVTPNHPFVAELNGRASNLMKEWTGDPSLNSYFSEDPDRVKNMAAAAFRAIREKNIAYACTMASYENYGQRIRLADAVMKQHMANCMDFTLLYAACLEAMGLNAFLVFVKGHVFAGVWLIDESFSELVMDDPSQLEKRMAPGIRELTVVECTLMREGVHADFEAAVRSAQKSVGEYDQFSCVIDLTRARKSGVRPLPVRIHGEKGYTVSQEDREQMEEKTAEKPEQVGEQYEYKEAAQKQKLTKEEQWERKLLDLSLRNMLINMRFTSSIVPLLSSSVSDLEDALVEGEEFQVLPLPEGWKADQEGFWNLEETNKLGARSELIALECRHRRLHTIYDQKTLNTVLTKIYRSARTSMEENGASTLYLAMGLLRWFERKSSKTERYAPLVLVPIEIIRKSASKGYVLRMRDEDAQINITLLEFLKQNYDIRINGLDPLPMDEHGLDMPRIFTAVRRGVMHEKMWDVIESGYIGNFSFSQFVMWNDIHSHMDAIRQNKIVRSLIKGRVDWDCRIPENVDRDEAYLPVTVDASQLRAVNMAANGVSFVLHGPPGTGKSQTITAMIANALAKGKKVLFVAEKMAALEVVQKRLAELGIGNFCLELHSNKAVKRSVLKQMQKSLETAPAVEIQQYAYKIQNIRKMREELDAYARKLHEKRHSGKSVRELIDLYESVPDPGTEVVFSKAFAEKLSQKDLDNFRHLLERLTAAGRAVGHPAGHPLREIRRSVYSQQLKQEMETYITAYKEALESYREGASALRTVIGLPEPAGEKDWESIDRYAQAVISSENIPDFLMESGELKDLFREPYGYLKEKEAFQEKRQGFLKRWNENFLCLDMQKFQDQFLEAEKKFMGKKRALRALTAQLQAYASFEVKTEEIPALLTDVEFLQKEQARVIAARERLSENWKQLVERYDSTEALEAYEREMDRKRNAMGPLAGKIRELKRDKGLEKWLVAAKETLERSERLQEASDKVSELLDPGFDKGEDEKNWISYREDFCGRMLAHKEEVKDWILYRQFEKQCRDAGLGMVCDAYEKGVAHNALLDVYQKSVYKALILSAIEDEPVLNSFTGAGFQERVLQFKRLDEEFMELTKEELQYRLISGLPGGYDSVTENQELNILRRAISSNGRGMSIRTLFEQIPHVLTKLCPCMLMSPISVSQYLSTDQELFDIVLFDEASQMPTCKAVGVLARGKNAVIVGDPNQMPPTSFFAGNTIDEDNLDIEDLDSILDDCLALGMPQAHLQWHYRSRHESLIAFSNSEFYENAMMTFPSVNDRESRVSLVRSGGYFERGKGRVNREEAAAVIMEIKKRYKDPLRKGQSLGVVTFNISQQTLIEDLLQTEFQKDQAFDAWANGGDEPLFIKNLENVQGDERDVILFSIAYGPDQEGRFSLNFGPLNRQGGWKRLNVAVTRARLEMVVFSSVTADWIDLKRTRSKGVEALKHFLEFAEKGIISPLAEGGTAGRNCGIRRQICSALSQAGYRFQTDVGHSGFKIDIGVYDPDDSDEYLLGILLDGEFYQKSGNTKDREISQICVLKGLGWTLHRIWAMDWWDNREKEIEKLLKLLDDQKRKRKEQSSDPGSDVALEKTVEQLENETEEQPEDTPAKHPAETEDI